VPKHPPSRKSKPLYRTPLPKSSALAANNIGQPIAAPHFELREDGSIHTVSTVGRDSVEPKSSSHPESQGSTESRPTIPNLILRDSARRLWLYHGNCLDLLDAIAQKYPEGRFDAIFADPPYFLSNGGITCHAGKMVRVDKGGWDKSRGSELNHEFNLEWLLRCQRVLKPDGTIWVSGTHHVIFSIGYAMQQLGYKILNDIAWEKPNPPPNLSCRYFTHSTETILWAAKNEKSKHVFNYQEMRKVTGKQMKTVWRKEEFQPRIKPDEHGLNGLELSEEYIQSNPAPSVVKEMSSVWTMTAPGGEEKVHGKHPTQKPVALVERCLLASTNVGDIVLDPFLGGGTTAIAALKTRRACVGIELDFSHLALAIKRSEREIIEIVLRSLRVRIEVSVFSENDLDLFSETINGSCAMDDKSQVPTERIYHERKFVFLSCAEVDRGSVVHTTVDVSLQEAWAKTPTGIKRETTHVVRCETEIFRVKN
jgi:site-specific DNA-methyltransferase (adenine-specific)